jgi:hypothetical protein
MGYFRSISRLLSVKKNNVISKKRKIQGKRNFKFGIYLKINEHLKYRTNAKVYLFKDCHKRLQ